MSDRIISAGANKYNEKNLFDEKFLSDVLNDKDACQYVLNILLDKDDLTVTKVVDRTAEKKQRNISEIADVSAVDGVGFTWEIVICMTNNVEPLHSRYEFARIIKRLADIGEGYSDTREMVVVYIGETDHCEQGKNVYTVRTYIAERSDEPVDDGTRIIFANSEADDGSEAAAMMKYFKTANPEEDSHGALSKRVRQLKNAQ